MKYTDSELYLNDFNYATGLPDALIDLSILDAVNMDIYIDRGDNYHKEFALFDSAGAALNLTGYSISATLTRYTLDSKTYALTSLIPTPVNGRILLSMTASNTSLLINNRYVYIVRITDGTNIISIFRGQVLVS